MNSAGVLTIDLGALLSNWQFIKRQALPSVETGAVIKANAYGLGAEPVARTLFNAGCRTFFFATAEEAMAVQGVFTQPVRLIVLGGVRPGDEPLFISGHLIPVLFSTDAVERWDTACATLGVAAPCVLKVDTGMTRLGISLGELQRCFEAVSAHFNPLYLMSHLSCADEFDHPANHQQLFNFQQAAVIAKHYYPDLQLSLANSSGVFLGDAWHFDLLRPGAALYGINPHPHLSNPLKPVVSLHLPIIQVRELVADSYVGYGATHLATAGQRLAVVAGGYADGLHRTLGVPAAASFNHQLVETVGRISMDSMIFDISCLAKEQAPRPGDWVEVIGSRLTLDTLMRKNAGLGYEVLTSLGARFQRIYLDPVNE